MKVFTVHRPERVLQFYSAEKQAEFAAMGPAERLAWLDEVRALYFSAQGR